MRVTVKRTRDKEIEHLGEIAWNDRFNISSHAQVIQYYQALAEASKLYKYKIEIDGDLVYFQ